MSILMNEIMAKASTLNKKIVLAEGEEERIIRAAHQITVKRIARVVLLGDEKVIKETCKDLSLDGIEIINPKTSVKTEEYAKLLYNLRKEKGMDMNQARSLAENNLYFGTLMMKAGDADGMVAGSINSTGDVLRPALQVIKAKKGIKTVSSCFIMVLPENSKYPVLVFGDCAVIPNPTAEQLCDIAIASEASARGIAGIKSPKVALLSFSTKCSAKHENVDKVVQALQLIKEKEPDMAVDGELQADAALVESVGKLKAPKSQVAGKANVLIFPDLQAGNIGYKLVQRLCGAEAIGPICQGLDKPVNDLSRGCSSEDVISVVAITALQASMK